MMASDLLAGPSGPAANPKRARGPRPADPVETHSTRSSNSLAQGDMGGRSGPWSAIRTWTARSPGRAGPPPSARAYGAHRGVHAIVPRQPSGNAARVTQWRCRATLAAERSGASVPVLREAVARAISVVAVLSRYLHATTLIRDAGTPEATQKAGVPGSPDRCCCLRLCRRGDPPVPQREGLPGDRTCLEGVGRRA